VRVVFDKSLIANQGLGFSPSAVLDIGANEGIWVTAMKEKLPGADFFCIEGNIALEK
jgi:hypothetical protein